MEFVDLLVFVSTCVGTTVIIVSGTIFEPLRNFIHNKSDKLGYLVSCSMCTGLWVGLLMSYIFGFPLYEGAVISSLFSWVVSNMVDAFYSVSIYFDSLLEDVENE